MLSQVIYSNRYINTDQRRKAAKLLKIEIEKGNERCNNLIELGHVLLENQKPNEALDIFLKANSYGEPLYEVYSGVIHAYLQMEKYEQANKFIDSLDQKVKNSMLGQLEIERSCIMMMQKKYEECKSILERSQEIFPDLQKTIFFNVGILNYQKHAFTNAYVAFQKAQDCDLSSMDILYHRAACLREMCKYEEAELLLSGAISTVNEEQLWRVFCELGALTRHRKDYSKSLDYIQEGLELSPENSILHHEYGVTCYQRKDYGLAINYFRKAIHLDDTIVDSVGFLADSYCEVKQYEEALLSIEDFYENRNDQTYYKKHIYRGLVYRKQNLMLESRLEFERAHLAAPNIAETNYQLGLAFFEVNEKERSMSFFKKSIEIDPYYLNSYFSLSQAIHCLYGPEKANKVLCDIEDLNIEGKGWLIGIAKSQLYSASKDSKVRIELLENTLKENPTNSQVLFILGHTFYENKMFKEAAESFDKAFQFDNSFFNALIYQVYALRELGLYKEALSLLDDPELEKKESISATLFLEKGNCYFCLGLFDEAVEAYKKGVPVTNNRVVQQIMTLADSFAVQKKYKKSLESYSQALRYDLNTVFS